MKQIDIPFKDLSPISWFDKNLKQIKKGYEGENEIRNFLSTQGINFMQIDLMFNYNNNYYCAEVKTQEKYLSPPFDGHGLPMWQIKSRMELYKQKNIIPYLFIRCLSDNVIYYQDLRILMQTEYFETKGKKPRVIFNLKEFKKKRLCE
ncbi:MAG TPA: hypothetical protein DHV22_17605 [Xanthomarina gelatinilytica]|mgnify:CR=1 FL=1|uniref:Endonuclease n=1 Tax=Xanthomarina gelatinilytica TaxID=1137281 RepID=A0A3D6BVM8_9FLAO|nr:hypothetical protein [Xanthomarina gelatinilytica]